MWLSGKSKIIPKKMDQNVKSCSAKDPIKGWKDKHRLGENMWNHKSDKGVVSRISKLSKLKM